MFAGKRLQRLLVGDILPGLGLARLLHQLELLEEQFAHLLRRAYVQRLIAGKRLSLFLYLDKLRRHDLRTLRQREVVDEHSVALHARQHLDERHLDVKEQFALLVHHLLFQHIVQLQRDVGILSRVLGNISHRHVTHRLLRLACTYERIDVDGSII